MNLKRVIGTLSLGAVCAAGGLTATPGTAGATAGPSTLSVDVTQDGCYVDGTAQVTLTFNNPSGFLFIWEYRADNEGPTGTAFGEDLWRYAYTGNFNGVDYGSAVDATFTYQNSAEHRLRMGDETDWFYDWESVGEDPCLPVTDSNACKRGGWQLYLDDFANQRACVVAVNAAQ